MGLYTFFGVDVPFDPECRLVTSNIVSSLGLAMWRLVIAVYSLFAIILIMVWYSVELHILNTYFTYFTNLTYIGICSYMWASSVQTLAYAQRVRGGMKPYYPLQHWPRFLQLLHVWLNATVNVFPFIVTLVYWVLLSAGSFDNRFDSWKNISVHALNSVIALIEIILSRSTPRWSVAPVLVFLMGCYLGVAYITCATQHYYTYDFLDPKRTGALLAAYIVGIAALAVIFLAIVKGICWVRDRTFAKSRNVSGAYEMQQEAGAV